MTAADFDKKVVVITGASGGIGNAIGRAFVDCRARVICADLQPPDIDVGMLFCRTDVGDDASARALFAFAEKECGGVDVLVNCRNRWQKRHSHLPATLPLLRHLPVCRCGLADANRKPLALPLAGLDIAPASCH